MNFAKAYKIAVLVARLDGDRSIILSVSQNVEVAHLASTVNRRAKGTPFSDMMLVS